MISHKDPDYITNGDMSADIVGPWINTCGFENVIFQASWGTVASTSGSFSIEGTCDPSKSSVVSLPSWGPTLNIFTSSPSAGTLLIASGVDCPVSMIDGILGLYPASPLPEFIRLRYTRSAGGAANQLQVQVIGRQ